MDRIFNRLNILSWIGLRPTKKGIKPDSNLLNAKVSNNIEWAIAAVYALNFIIPEEVGIFRNEKILSDARHYISNSINEALPSSFRLPLKRDLLYSDRDNVADY